ncbi:MAG: Maf family nucleotide pyrophosphatase [Nanoarchaeota archaeon]|nr:Maf family nucleotide pyrophosphatase [Nanoarchaeota archaeon]
MKRKIILASGSPRRKELLSTIIGNNFEIITSDYDEDNNLDMKPEELVLHHAINKGRYVAKKVDSGVVISADTIVVCNGEVIGKPKDPEDAIKILNRVNGQIVDVLTGLTVIDVDNKKEITDTISTKVYMKSMTDKEIKDYVDSEEPLDKAGAFAIQGKGSIYVEKVEGCYFNVVGFPLFNLNQIFEKLDISIFDYL